ncbi:PREDICTED: cell cycle control protein 50A-like isoform X2 [Papilio polytes]|uniref:cell cycle control protein 50A-like isoform X2 n=1 Tax=Papilio polytes TaxID=76194 RepID=UPI00067634F3|nr:PREDICTED: cell cycle control protein 50A-like isoform X2 [Papilio polytes]
MELKKSTAIKLSLGVYTALTLVFLIVGIIRVCSTVNETKVNIKRLPIDYTNCKNNRDVDQTCAQYLNENNGGDCKCDIYFKLNEDYKGNVTIYYQLDGYQETFGPLFNSSDPTQWSGVLTMPPSDKCQPYQYSNTTMGIKPIVPCGGLADAMFNDTYRLFNTQMQIQMDEMGLISDAERKKYKNPVNIIAVQEFTKPVNWPMSIWDIGQGNFTGFLNDRFIIWMNTKLHPKPVAKVRKTSGFENGLPKDDYHFKFFYNYPPSRYNGTRTLILEAVEHMTVQKSRSSGWVLLILGLILILLGIIAYVLRRGHFFDITDITINLPFLRKANENEPKASPEERPLGRERTNTNV